MANVYDEMGMALAKKLFGALEFDVTEYCDAAIDEALDYCLQEFKKACEREDIEWNESWEAILHD